jgi:hypothetical protein
MYDTTGNEKIPIGTVKELYAYLFISVQVRQIVDSLTQQHIQMRNCTIWELSWHTFDIYLRLLFIVFNT